MHLSTQPSPKRPASSKRPGGSRAPGGLALAALGLAALAPAADAQTQDLFVANQSNTISRFAGTGPGTFSTTATTLTDSSLNTPSALAFDASGDLFVANNGGSITEFTAGATPGTFGATTTITGPGLTSLIGLTVDARGDLFVTQGGNNITELMAGATPGTFGATTTITDPFPVQITALATDASGNLFAAANNGLSNRQGGLIEFPFMPGTGGAPGTFGPATGAGIGGVTFPSGVAVDARGDVFTDSLRDGTVFEAPAGATPGTFGAQRIIGSGLSEPEGLAVDALGDLFVANTFTGTITKFGSTGPGTFGPAQTVESGLPVPSSVAFGPSVSAPVPEASTTVSLGLLLALGVGGMVIAAKRKKANGKAGA